MHVRSVRDMQTRKNRLLLTGGGAGGDQTKLPAADFTRHTLRFMGAVAVPYLFQRTLFESSAPPTTRAANSAPSVPLCA